MSSKLPLLVVNFFPGLLHTYLCTALKLVQIDLTLPSFLFLHMHTCILLKYSHHTNEKKFFAAKTLVVLQVNVSNACYSI